uniref:Uncharacterized protein n=1 Tax=Knipowitschia caucasica TaxID=637954 RepID=A0AAV2MQL9_KNICA
MAVRSRLTHGDDAPSSASSQTDDFTSYGLRKAWPIGGVTPRFRGSPRASADPWSGVERPRYYTPKAPTHRAEPPPKSHQLETGSPARARESTGHAASCWSSAQLQCGFPEPEDQNEDSESEAGVDPRPPSLLFHNRCLRLNHRGMARTLWDVIINLATVNITIIMPYEVTFMRANLAY